MRPWSNNSSWIWNHWYVDHFETTINEVSTCVVNSLCLMLNQRTCMRNFGPFKSMASSHIGSSKLRSTGKLNRCHPYKSTTSAFHNFPKDPTASPGRMSARKKSRKKHICGRTSLQLVCVIFVGVLLRGGNRKKHVDFLQDLYIVCFFKIPLHPEVWKLSEWLPHFAVESFHCGFFHLVEAIKPCTLIPLQVGWLKSPWKN